jgi:hypothetical protein
MRESGLSKKTYNEYLKRAYDEGLINPNNKITPKELLEPFRDGNDWYGIGP